MAWVQIGNKVYKGAEVVAEADKEGFITAVICDLCNELVPVKEIIVGTVKGEPWQCAKCSAVN